MSMLIHAQTSRQWHVNSCQNIPINPQNILNKIANVINLDINNLSIQQSSDLCFSEIYNLCKQKKWAIINELKDEVNQLVNAVGQTLLVACIYQKDEILFQGLIEKEIAIHKPSKEGNLPLHYASQMGLIKFVEQLINYNKINVENKFNQTPLHLAAYYGHERVIAFLLEKGSKIYIARWDYGSIHLELTPMALSIIGGHTKCVDLFLQKTSLSPRIQFSKIGNFLHLAVFFRQNQLLERFLTLYIDKFLPQLEELNDQGQTPLMLAAYLGNETAICLLIKKGGKLDVMDGNGNTALHWAVLGKQRNAVSILIKHGANCHMRNRQELEADKLADRIEAKSIGAYISNFMHEGLYQERANLNYISYPPENLVLKGGGPKGIAYVGVLEELEVEMMSSLKRVAGTSAGAIFAALIAVNYTSVEIRGILENLNLIELLDHPLIELKNAKMKSNLKTTFALLEKLAEAFFNPIGMATTIFLDCLQSLWYTTGICKGEKFRQLMEKYLFEKTRLEFCTFGELREFINKGKPFRHFHVFATKIGSDSRIIQMSSENPEWDKVIISDAIRGSMSIPGVFKPHHLHIKEGEKRIPIPEEYVVVDGGLLNNLPLETFDRKKIRLDSFYTRGSRFSCL